MTPPFPKNPPVSLSGCIEPDFMADLPTRFARMLIVLATGSMTACVTLPETGDGVKQAGSATVQTSAHTVRPVDNEPALRTARQIDPERTTRQTAPPASPPPAGLDFANNIYFPAGSAEIDGRGRSTLQTWAEKLKANRDQRVSLTGHTDHLGSREYNISLGQKRVDEVSRELTALGVWSRQIVRRTSYGNEAGSCRNAECRQSLRRVELGN